MSQVGDEVIPQKMLGDPGLSLESRRKVWAGDSGVGLTCIEVRVGES